MKKTVVLYPGLGVGHLVPMVELAKVFLDHGLAVAVALVEPADSPAASAFSAAVARAKASNPSVAFHVLPPPPPAPADDKATPTHHLMKMLHLLAAMNAPLRDFLRSLQRSSPVHALVIDMFCADAQDVADELGIPAYYAFSSAASNLAVFLNLPSKLAAMDTQLLRDSSTISFPGVPPFKPSDLPSDVAAQGEALDSILRVFERLPQSDGILINSMESLEPLAVQALEDGLCVPGRPTPSVYCIGPLVSAGAGDDEQHECLRWLDSQPDDNSIVFLSFGSMGTFSKNQLSEIATGLEKSGQRFLWVVRSPLPDPAHHRPGDPLPEITDLGSLLPHGFLDRTRDRGLVAPQVEVLRHRATGAFVTHCGWNSTLEGVAAAGLPLLCWPLYAEQRMNKVYVVEGMGLGVEMRGLHIR
ncbi:UDP-glycosyltransferase 88A1-like [Brachypodium distachyon]|uniref:UDP-glycosyltransferase 88A1-like n=1 Tax=Brachypodium distachyon TaxID=15368 RepID=UPI000D0D2C2F|nr:UDP-glycosyltransferase 88A1-like [Brachypodium distachyon]|eukprot:XP_014758491.2 UDP-glycosyltransferase 88A1-like [Brachypodium distachyon]